MGSSQWTAGGLILEAAKPNRPIVSSGATITVSRLATSHIRLVEEEPRVELMLTEKEQPQPRFRR